GSPRRSLRPSSGLNDDACHLFDREPAFGARADFRDAARGPPHRGPWSGRRAPGGGNARQRALTARATRPDDRAARIVLGIWDDPCGDRRDHGSRELWLALGL